MKEQVFLDIIKGEIPESSQYIGDDTAYIPEKDLILTQDTLIEDIHFRMRTISPFYLGRKSVAVNLSDIAASGGIPSYILISLSMPKSIEKDFVKEFYKGVSSICREYEVLVVGGDLTASEKVAISICAIGSGKGLIPANRRNAKPGDVVAIIGNCASSKAGLDLLEGTLDITKAIKTKLIEAPVNTVPLVSEGRKLLEATSNPAMMDTSDGLADALYKICEMSAVSMDIEFNKIPYESDIEQIFKDEISLKNAILFGGEDYALIATLSEEIYKKLKPEMPLKKIGLVKPSGDTPCAYVKFKDEKVMKIGSATLESGVFKHFE